METRPDGSTGGAILLRVDDRGRWRPLLAEAVEIARRERVTINLCAVCHPQPIVWSGSYWSVPHLPDWDRREAAHAHACLCAAVAEVPHDVDCRTLSLRGSSAWALIMEARSGRYAAVLTAAPFPFGLGPRLFARLARVLSIGCSVDVIVSAREGVASTTALAHQSTARSA